MFVKFKLLFVKIKMTHYTDLSKVCQLKCFCVPLVKGQMSLHILKNMRLKLGVLDCRTSQIQKSMCNYYVSSILLYIQQITTNAVSDTAI